MKKIFAEIIAALLVLFFIYVSFSKLFNMKEFTGDINNQPFANWLTPYLVWTLPILEILIALSLLFIKTRKAGLYAFLGLMLIFTGYITMVLLHFYSYVPCSCGGLIKSLTWPEHLLLNLLAMALAVLCLWLSGYFIRNKQQPALEQKP